MTESKIALTERLRREGRWAEASKLKDEAIKEAKKAGMKSDEAKDAGWDAMEKAYPPTPPVPEPADVEPSGPTSEVANRAITYGDLDEWLEAALRHEVQKCLDQYEYAVTLGTDAMEELVNALTGFCLVLQPSLWPGPRYCEEDELLYDPLSEPEPEPSAPQAAVAE